MNAVLNSPVMEKCTLYFREGSSDKVYQCSIEPSGELFVVNFAYGRRGSTLTTGTKTSLPVDYDTAKKVFDKLVREKTSKGYTSGADGTPYTQTAQSDRTSGILPQLLNAIDEEDVNRLISDANWCLQEKFDGRRVMLMRAGPVITGVNRKGLTIGLPSSVMKSGETIRGDYIIDGEAVGETLHAFDILSLNGEDLCEKPYRVRLLALMKLLGNNPVPNIRIVETAFDANDKTSHFRELRDHKKEGAVLKRLDAPYKAGRPNSGGSQLKHKFYATVSVVVAKVNRQRSVELRLLNQEGWELVGNVTIPPNHRIPPVGTIVEVRYLYAFPESNCLFQPVYLGERTDIGSEECVLSQLKYKVSEEDES
jgi:bifunctional non-homologous end joining protein LigD